MHLLGIKGTNIDLTDAIKTYINEKIEAFEQLVQDFEPVADLRVEIGKTTNHHNKGEVFRAEMQMHVPGTVIRAEETAEDLYEAIDKVKDQVKRQLNDYKNKLSDKNQRATRPGKE